MLRCEDGTLYVGSTADLPSRLDAHNDGRGGHSTEEGFRVLTVGSCAGWFQRSPLPLDDATAVRRFPRSEPDKPELSRPSHRMPDRGR
ncbi:MAG: GIY-YIG nuclease family protein [Vicinamibacterales bacterium]